MKRPLRFYAALYAAAFALLITGAATFVLVQVVRYIQADRHEDMARSLADKARAVSQLIEFYRGVAQRIAREPKTLDHVLFDTAQQAENWSIAIRRRLPDVVGLALFTGKGKLLGDAPNQRIGPECLADMTMLASGKPVAKPPVHRNVPHLAHFDITVPVMQQDRRMGVLFISVSLDALETTLDALTAPGEMLTLRTTQGEPLMTSGRSAGNPSGIEREIAVAGTDWILGYRTVAPALREVYLNFAAVTTITVIVIAGAIMFLTRDAIRKLAGDLRVIQQKLSALAGGNAPDKSNGVYLREVEEMLPSLDFIAGIIHRRHQRLIALSETDSLTSLPNRRALESHFGHYLGLARRGPPVVLGLVDIDRFKEVNDEHGHNVGDAVLRGLAEALRQSIRASDMAARLGGDEFVVLLVDMDAGAVQHWFDRLQMHFQNAAPSSAAPVTLRVSGGFMLLQTDRDIPLAAALARADKALYEAKKKRHGQCRIAGDDADQSTTHTPAV